MPKLKTRRVSLLLSSAHSVAICSSEISCALTTLGKMSTASAAQARNNDLVVDIMLTTSASKWSVSWR